MAASIAGQDPRDTAALPTAAFARDPACPCCSALGREMAFPTTRNSNLLDGKRRFCAGGRHAKCGDVGCLSQGINQPRGDLETSAGSAIILALMT